jgi:hypothetical protein
VFGLLFACVLIPVFFASAGLGSLAPGIQTFETEIRGPMAIYALVLGLLLGSLGTIFVTSVWTLAYRHWRADKVVRPVSQEPSI